MRPRFTLARRAGWWLSCAACSLACAALAAAQTEKVEVEPVTCWWRTSAAGVRIGEAFDVVLTCSFLQTEAARVIADESRLEPAVVQLQPFEVVGGSRARDLTTAGRRFVQFEYRIRAIAENVFASEIVVPPLEISYRVESRLSGGESLAGRDLAYVLPPLTMRVLSLVPDTADDIREAPIATFATIEALESRGTMFRVAAGTAFTLGALMLAVAVAASIRGRRSARGGPPRMLRPGVVLAGVRRELNEVQDAVRASGWTAALAARVLAAARIVAAYATGRPVAQRPASAGTADLSSGEVAVGGRGRAAAVAATVAAVDDDELREAIATLSAARYGRDAITEGSANVGSDARLDAALDAVVRRAERLIADRPWLEKVWLR